jgi:hypothetical protein
MGKKGLGALWPLYSLNLPVAAALLAVCWVSLKTGIPISLFTRDPADITGSSPFLGVLSNFGILLWCSTVAICVFAFLLLRRLPGRQKTALFLLLAALLSTLLMLDDFFLFHERVFPEVLHWRQRYPLILYALLTGGYLLAFRKTILESDYRMLVAAFGFFALSIGVDAVQGPFSGRVPFHHLLEDGFKLFGLANWLGYFGQCAWQAVSAGPVAEAGNS